MNDYLNDRVFEYMTIAWTESISSEGVIMDDIFGLRKYKGEDGLIIKTMNDNIVLWVRIFSIFSILIGS